MTLGICGAPANAQQVVLAELGDLVGKAEIGSEDRLMKIEWLVTDVTADGSPARVKRICCVILGIFWPIQAACVVLRPLCDLKIPT